MSYDDKRKPSLLRRLLVVVLLLAVIPIVVPTFYGIWAPDFARGELLVLTETDSINRVMQFRLVQQLDSRAGYSRTFYYTINDRQWFGMNVGRDEPKLWNGRMECSTDYKSFRIFDRSDEKIRIEWSKDMDRYVWVHEDGTPAVTKLEAVPDPNRTQ